VPAGPGGSEHRDPPNACDDARVQPFARTHPPERSDLRIRFPRRGAAALVAMAAVLGLLTSCSKDGGSSEGTTSKPSQTQVGPGSVTTSTGDSDTTSSTGPTTAPKVKAVAATDADEPTYLLPRPGDPGHVYVAERAGHIRRFRVGAGGKLSAEGGTLLDISKDTTTQSERGLLALAFSKDGDTIYVSHTNVDGNTRVESYAMKGNTIDASTKEELLAQDQPFPNHNGGNIVLGPDGKLWFGFGDGGAGDDPQNHAQDPKSLLGKIIRFAPGEDPETVIMGVRNPWRFSFDTDGSLWIGDVGQDQWEEVDHLAAGDIDGTNLGWSGFAGTHPHLEGDGRRPADATPPIFDYEHVDGNCSITGGFVYRGKAIPALDGAYLFADYCAGNLRALTLDAKGGFGRELDLGIHVDSPVSFGTDEDGEAYLLSQTGTIYRLTAA
jgi:glucose/arabinose dehydrogenase